MKIAALIIAHQNIEHLIRLIKRLQHQEIDIYVHIDNKWKDFNLEQLKKSGVFVQVLPYRGSGQLDNWELVDITLRLIEYAKSRDSYSYYMLLSGNDYLLANTDTIVSRLRESYPRDFMDCTPYAQDNWVGTKFLRHYSYSLDAYLYNLQTGKHIKRILRGILRRIDYLKSNFVKLPYEVLEMGGIKIYGGSAWWILSDVSINYIHEFVQSERTAVSALMHTWTPEEIFFQTVCMTSKEISSHIEVNDQYEREQNCLTYAYFTDSYVKPLKKPFKGHPYIFQYDDKDFVDKLLSQNKYFFARKFDVRVSSEIMDYIDRRLEGK